MKTTERRMENERERERDKTNQMTLGEGLGPHLTEEILEVCLSVVGSVFSCASPSKDFSNARNLQQFQLKKPERKFTGSPQRPGGMRKGKKGDTRLSQRHLQPRPSSQQDSPHRP